MGELVSILKIYAYAREQMKLNGNPTQWGDKHPAESVVIDDIKSGNSYVILKDGEICGVFSFILGKEPTYAKIEGEWKNQEPYGTIHRVASNGATKGIFDACIEFCQSNISNLRIDTHLDNKIVQYLIEKNNFERCGIIYVADGTPRIAYEKCANISTENELSNNKFM